MRIEDKFLGGSFVKVFVTLGSLVQFNDLYVDSLGNINLAEEDGLHQLSIVFHHRALSCGEDMRPGPAQTDADAQPAHFGIFIDPAGISSHVETWNDDSA